MIVNMMKYMWYPDSPVVRNLQSEEYGVAFLYPQQEGRFEYELENSAERLQITDKKQVHSSSNEKTGI